MAFIVGNDRKRTVVHVLTPLEVNKKMLGHDDHLVARFNDFDFYVTSNTRSFVRESHFLLLPKWITDKNSSSVDLFSMIVLALLRKCEDVFPTNSMDDTARPRSVIFYSCKPKTKVLVSARKVTLPTLIMIMKEFLANDVENVQLIDVLMKCVHLQIAQNLEKEGSHAWWSMGGKVMRSKWISEVVCMEELIHYHDINKKNKKSSNERRLLLDHICSEIPFTNTSNVDTCILMMKMLAMEITMWNAKRETKVKAAVLKKMRSIVSSTLNELEKATQKLKSNQDYEASN